MKVTKILFIILLNISLLIISYNVAYAQGVTQFVDGYGGNVTTAKDSPMSLGWPTFNGGRHSHAQFEVNQRFLMEFDLSSIPANATIVDATLYLYHGYEPEGRSPVNIYIYSISAANAAWQEGDKDIRIATAGENTWNALAADGAGGVQTPWAGSPGLSTPGVDYEGDHSTKTGAIGSFLFDSNAPLNQEYVINLNPERVKGWFGNQNTNYGIIFYSDNNVGHVTSSDDITTSLRPKLVVNYTTGSTTPTPNLSPTPTITPTNTITPTITSTPTPTPLPGDINGDRVVNILDYTLLSNAFGTSNAASDLNDDGIVNILDYILLSNNFGRIG